MSLIPRLRRVGWSLPHLSARLLIRWWMILRVTLVATTMAVVIYFSGAGRLLPLAVALVTVAVSAVFYRQAVKGRGASEVHCFFQYFFDICLISLVNLITLPLNVNFIPLYVLSIAVASIFSFRPGAFFTATVASVAYLPVGLRILNLGFALTETFQFNVLYLADRWTWLNVGLQVFLFYCVAAITSYLSLRLRKTGSELEDTRNLLSQYRLDHREIVHNITSGLITCDPSGRILEVNPAARRILALPEDYILKQPAAGLFAAGCPEISKIIRLAVESDVMVAHRKVELVSAGRHVPLRVSSSVMKDRDGRLRGVSLVFEDITIEEKARELELRGTRLEAVAELAASLAHEIKNPLTSIRSAIELIGEKTERGRDEVTDRLMECVLKESDRLAELLRQFLQFSRGHSGPLEDIRLGDLLEEVRQAVSNNPDWRGEVELLVSPSVARWRVAAPPGALSQVFYNLLINAVQVTGRDGEKTNTIEIRSAERRTEGLPERRGMHMVAVCDDGPGIDSDFRQKIFEPFFSTRKEGFGLGLAVVHRIMSSMGGMIFVLDESPLGGAAFAVGMPRVSDGPGGRDKQQQQEKPTAGTAGKKTGEYGR
ncbi:MAG: PAS domain-containing protein [Candidatus Glassbacteria bacterium]|nr:PAS domain-containing protein [Candidatus Glassbacteria bacterium]